MKESKLANAISTNGIKLGFVADSIGISRASLRNKISGRSDFSRKEVLEISLLLGLNKVETSEIFFEGKLN